MLVPSTGAGGQDLLRNLQRSQSAETVGLGNCSSGNPDRTIPNPKKGPKVNQFALTKRINTKIQALASKQTDIIVWTTNVWDADLLLDC